VYNVASGVDPNGNRIPYEAIISRDHHAGASASLYDGYGALLLSDIRVLGGQVTVDRTAAHRRQCSVEVGAFGKDGLAIDNIIPKDPTDPLAPYGPILKVWRSILIPDAINGFQGASGQRFRMTVWQQGVFRLSEASVSDDGVPKLKVTGYDHSRTVARNKFTLPYVVAAGQNYGDAIIAMCRDRLPTLEDTGHSVTATTPQIVVDPEQDPWETAQSWASAVGCEVYFNVFGQLVIRPEPDLASDPVVWTYADGSSSTNSTLLQVERSMDDEPGYNGVVLTSESNTLSTPIRSEVWDDNPSSPTYANGPYGRVPKFVSSPLVTTQAQGDAAARAELLRSSGGTSTLTLATIPNPAQEAGDVVRVLRPASRTDLTAVLDGFTMPLDLQSPMTVRTRERRSIDA
jgi:hypothetical protein